MPRIASRIEIATEECAARRQAWLALIADWRAIERRARDASARATPVFERRGQLPPRERVARMLDPASPFLELATLAGFGHDTPDADKSIPGAGMIAGIGEVHGARCMIVASDSGIDAGAIQPMGLDKILRCLAIARDNKLPFVHLVESAGANLLRYRVQDFIGGGALFRDLARLSAAGIPVVTVVHGASTAGGAYMPGMSDYVIMVRGRARAFLAGPALLKAATGEDANEEELGGAAMHASVSGLAEYVADNDADALRLAREVIARLDWNRDRMNDARHVASPQYEADELLGIVPLDSRKSYDVREVIARVVDASDFLDFKPLFGAATVCGHATVHGHAVGIIGNNGPLDPAGANKTSQFIQLCCQSATPLVYLQNTTGYLVGTAAERAGMIKHGAKMIQAVATATVPQITLHIGASFGAGNYGMCGRAYQPRFCFSWPNAKTAVMGAEQAAATMRLVTEAKQRRAGAPADAALLDRLERDIIDTFERQSSAFATSALLLDDGIIDPRDTRRVLALTLDVCREAERRALHPIQFGVARH